MQLTNFNSSSIVARELVADGTCLFRARYLVTALHDTISTPGSPEFAFVLAT
jgi:hypothetical protein